MSEPYWSALGSAGDVDYAGDFNPATQYAPGHVVRHGGIDFLAVNPSLGVTPPVVAGGPLGEMAYAESTSPVSVTANAEATPTDVISSGSRVYDGSPILIEFYSPRMDTPPAGANTLRLSLWDGATNLGLIGTFITGDVSVAMATAGVLLKRLVPTPGTHEYRIRAYCIPAGSGTVAGGAGGAGNHNPLYIRISRANPIIPIAPGHLVPVSYATTLPASPVDGQEAILVDSLTAPTYSWRFRYVAGITDAYKWVFIGGAPLAAPVLGYDTTASATYVDLATVGPSLIAPRAGVYVAHYDTEMGNNTATGTVAGGRATLKNGAAAANDAQSLNLKGSNLNIPVRGAMTVRITVAAAGDVLKLQYRAEPAGTAYFIDRNLSIIPVRVS